MDNCRNYYIIIGSKGYFDEEVDKKFSGNPSELKSFIELVRLSDEKSKNGIPFSDDDKADCLLIKNDHYHGIVDTAHDRLGTLIEEVTTESAEIYVHNPTSKLYTHINNLKLRKLINLYKIKQEYSIERKAELFNDNMRSISKNIIGQEIAISEISKSLWYLTTIKRKKPYVIMLYGDSSLGKSELVREIAKYFFQDRFVEKHLSMFKNESYSYYFFGNVPNRTSLGFDLLERESNLLFLDELDKCPEYFFSAFYTLFDNVLFQDATYHVDISGLFIILTSNFSELEQMKKTLGMPIFYRIDKFISFSKFQLKTIYEITKKEIELHIAESKGKLTFDDVYRTVAPFITRSNENARTIKNKVQKAVEDLLFKEINNY